MWNDKLGRFIDSRFFLITCKMVYPGGRVKFSLLKTSGTASSHHLYISLTPSL